MNFRMRQRKAGKAIGPELPLTESRRIYGDHRPLSPAHALTDGECIDTV